MTYNQPNDDIPEVEEEVDPDMPTITVDREDYNAIMDDVAVCPCCHRPLE